MYVKLRNSDGKFFFELQYPKLSKIQGYKWKQTADPFTITGTAHLLELWTPDRTIMRGL